MQNIYRHGDVLIQRVESLPKNTKPVKRDKGRIILAYGEVTGHAHAITEKTAKGFLCGDDLFLALEKEATIAHEEHAAITLEPGVYRVIHQVEYRRKEIVRVAD